MSRIPRPSYGLVLAVVAVATALAAALADSGPPLGF
jgi:hypothetical protein